MLLLTLRGTPTLYYGDELGMADVPIPPERAVDPGMARDPVRTPMRWDAGPHAGFSTAEPWLPVGEGAAVAAQRDDPRSMLTLYRRLLALRRESDDLAERRLPDAARGRRRAGLRARRPHRGRAQPDRRAAAAAGRR